MMKRLKGVRRTIETINGTKYYIGTEIEDEYERWNDNYWTPFHYVIHEGRYHHVFGSHEAALRAAERARK